jgi:L,D-transpeptidase YcbB
MIKRILFIFCLCLYCLISFSQLPAYAIKGFLDADKITTLKNLKHPTEIKEFYKKNDYNSIWLNNSANTSGISDILKGSAKKGLDEKEYQYEFITLYSSGNLRLKNAADSIEAELRFADAALHYYHDIAHGNNPPNLSYDGINFKANCFNIPLALTDALAQNFKPKIENVEANSSVQKINQLEKAIESFYEQTKIENFKEVTVSSKKADSSNKELLIKLQQLGIIKTGAKSITGTILKEKIKEAQELFNLYRDGIIRTTLLQELNVPLKTRLLQLNTAINYYRWLKCLYKNEAVVLVNIPAAYLKVFKEDKVVLEMKTIVGKKKSPTPTLSSTITEVVLYPYWHVPYSIATKELLPQIKKNRKVINDGNYQILDGSGKVINPYTINWNKLSRNYFPYTIRQSTGCDNSLGLIKLNFYNPFSVYLHDTPNKLLFSSNKRYFSHGCMRMEKPADMAHFILKTNSIAIDTLEQKGCIKNQAPVPVPALEKIKVVVWYNMVDLNSNGKLVFYEDIYEKYTKLPEE